MADEVSKFVIQRALAVMSPQTAKKFMAQIKAQIKNKKLISEIEGQRVAI